MTHLHLLRTDTIGDVLLVVLHDSVGGSPDYTLLDEFEVVRNQRRAIGSTKVLLDLAQAEFFGSTLLELIRVLWNDISDAGGKLVLCSPTPFGREVLAIAKFDQVWPIVDTREQALALLHSSNVEASWPTTLKESIALYDRGPSILRESLDGFSSIQLRTPSPPGVWSPLQIVCHIADFELVYADRMKRVIAEDKPTLFGGDPDVFAAKLAYAQRDIEEELDVISSVRRSTSRFLKTLAATEFDRTGVHSVDGPITLTRLIERIAGHIPHHVKLVEGKKQNFQGQIHKAP